jgi:hypothetical protein
LAVIVVPDPDGDWDGLVIAARLIGAVVRRAVVVTMTIAIAVVVMSIGRGSAKHHGGKGGNGEKDLLEHWVNLQLATRGFAS